MKRHPRWHPQRYIVRYAANFGRRGVCLALLGAMWLLVGLSCVVIPPSDDYWLLSGPGWPRALGWLITGALAIVYSRRPQGDDALGFVALYVMAAFRITAYGLAFIQWVATGGEQGNPRGIVGATTWIAVLMLVVVVAGWREPEEKR